MLISRPYFTHSSDMEGKLPFVMDIISQGGNDIAYQDHPHLLINLLQTYKHTIDQRINHKDFCSQYMVIHHILQKHFDLVMISPTLAYPVVLKSLNFVIAFGTILVLGVMASKIASWSIKKLNLSIQTPTSKALSVMSDISIYSLASICVQIK